LNSQVASFQITKAGWQDLNDMRKLEQVCFGADAWPIWDLIAALTLPKVVRLKAVVDEKMAGIAIGDPHAGESIGWIASLGVLPDYRRRGIAAALLDECERQLGFPRIRLSVRKDNQPAITLYRNAGYAMIDIWRHYYHSGEDALVFEKRR
jgi:ribosomal protein S18 acetylase RimI-like enzyme